MLGCGVCSGLESWALNAVDQAWPGKARLKPLPMKHDLSNAEVF